MSGINLMRLGFDTTSTATMNAGANVGAYLRNPAGALATYTGTSLDVNVTNSLTINVDGVYDGGTNTNPDNVGIIAHIRNAAPGDTQQTFRSTGAAASSDANVAANIFGLDVNSAGMLFNGTTWDRARSYATGVAKVVQTGGWKVTADTVGLTEVQLAATPLANRCKAIIQNLGNQDIYLGEATGVLTTTGFQVPSRSEAVLEVDAAAEIWAIGDAAGMAVRIAEFAV